VLTLGLLVKAFAGGLLGAPERDRLTIEPVTIDLNRAALAELQVLPGVGQRRAEAIILHRLRHGPFRRIEDLEQVEGFGAATVAPLRPFLRL
jgi:competence protein ComEA